MHILEDLYPLCLLLVPWAPDTNNNLWMASVSACLLYQHVMVILYILEILLVLEYQALPVERRIAQHENKDLTTTVYWGLQKGNTCLRSQLACTHLWPFVPIKVVILKRDKVRSVSEGVNTQTSKAVTVSDYELLKQQTRVLNRWFRQSTAAWQGIHVQVNLSLWGDSV